MERIVCILIGYIFGLFQTGYLYGRMNHVDIRKMGSGNAGSTNALRTLESEGRGYVRFWEILLSVFLPYWRCAFIFGGNYGEILPLLSIYAGLEQYLDIIFRFIWDSKAERESRLWRGFWQRLRIFGLP